MTKETLIAKLDDFRYGLDGFWLVAGAALVLYGIRQETGDIDMGCTTEAADRLEADGFLYQVMEDGNRWFRLDLETEVFENWFFDAVVLFDGYPVLSLQGLREMKQRLGREKDLRDIQLINAFIARDPADASG